MTYKVGFIVEEIGTPGKSTSDMLAAESVKRGFETYSMRMCEISLNHSSMGTVLTAPCHKVIGTDYKKLAEEKEATVMDLAGFDFILIRTNPPFDVNYFTTMKFLQMLPKSVIVTNPPASIIDLPEKLSPLLYPEYFPPTLISRDMNEIKHFVDEHKDVICKPLYHFGARGISKINSGDEIQPTHERMVYQKFLSRVKEGSKRIFLMDGEISGAYLTLPASGTYFTTPDDEEIKTGLTAQETKTCEIIGQLMKKHDILLAGIDTVGEYIMEINITSPGGFDSVNDYYNRKMQAEFWNMLLLKRA